MASALQLRSARPWHATAAICDPSQRISLPCTRGLQDPNWCPRPGLEDAQPASRANAPTMPIPQARMVGRIARRPGDGMSARWRRELENTARWGTIAAGMPRRKPREGGDTAVATEKKTRTDRPRL